jgi:hypothetical protein
MQLNCSMSLWWAVALSVILFRDGVPIGKRKMNRT